MPFDLLAFSQPFITLAFIIKVTDGNWHKMWKNLLFTLPQHWRESDSDIYILISI